MNLTAARYYLHKYPIAPRDCFCRCSRCLDAKKTGTSRNRPARNRWIFTTTTKGTAMQTESDIEKMLDHQLNCHLDAKYGEKLPEPPDDEPDDDQTRESWRQHLNAEIDRQNARSLDFRVGAFAVQTPLFALLTKYSNDIGSPAFKALCELASKDFSKS